MCRRNWKKGFRCTVAGWLLASAVQSGAAFASPIIPERQRDVARDTGFVLQDTAQPLTAVGDAVREVRRTGPAVTPSLPGIDDGFLGNGGLLHSELRDETNAPWTRTSPTKSPNDLLRDTLGNALKETRDAFFDGSDSANFSISGVELGAVLRGDRRSVTVNGYDLLAWKDVTQATWQPAATAAPSGQGANDTATAQRHSGSGDGRSMLSELRKLASHPMTVIAVVALAIVWLVAAAWDRSGSRNS